jgi:hypothetical protein
MKSDHAVDQPNTSMRRIPVIHNHHLATRDYRETPVSAAEQQNELRDSLQESRKFITDQQKDLTNLRRTATERQSIPEYQQNI